MYLTKALSGGAISALLFAIVCTALAAPGLAGNGKRHRSKSVQRTMWQETERRNLKDGSRSLRLADETKVFRVDQKMLRDTLMQAPLEFTDAVREKQVILEIPTPEGKMMKFLLFESPMLSSEIAAQFPTWKTYAGQGIDDPTATARFDLNANGFHGYVIGAGGTFLIDPYSEKDSSNYVAYYKGSLNNDHPAFSCRVGGRETNRSELSAMTAPQAFSNGTQLRNFRLAMAATKEYTNFFGGNVTTAFAAVQTTVNRMITVYRRDLATTFTLVTGTAHMFTNANDGGYPAATNSMVADLSLPRNQIVMDSGNNGNPGPVGSANYDIGHLLSRTGNPNGLATSPSLCDPTAKAQGFTGAPVPQGDGYDVDYVAHEIGHQFAMSHTFNNDVDGSCGTRATDSAFEPASGVTIMGYAGICAPRNLSANSIEYFNLRSFDQSLAWFQSIVQGVNGTSPTCGTPTTNGNSVPVVTGGGTFNIPKQTPFALTASATDANSDPLTYSWEEFDVNANGATGSAAAPSAMPPRNNTDIDTDENGTVRPIFRAYNPTISGSRTFPSLYYILNNANTPPLTYTGTLPFAPTSGSTNGYVCAASETCVTGERLPAIARTMNFRVTVRDNNAAGGGIADGSATVVVAGGAGPFVVTTQDTAPVAWAANSIQQVTWNVANTTAAPINAANVKITLSTDGGLTFPITLLASTPNDGTEPITVPNNQTSTARIKVEAVGNIFFDINNANFQISAPATTGVGVGNASGTETGGARSLANAPSNNTFDFLVTRTGDLSGNSTVHYNTVDGTATVADHDYEPQSGDLVFAFGESTKHIFVVIDSDSKVEPTESFTVHLSSPTGVTITDPDGQGTILNDDVRARADFDGDGKTDLSIFRPTEGNWYINRSTAGLMTVHWGISTDTLVPGDYDGDSKTDYAVFRPTATDNVADFYILNSSTFTLSGYAWGVPGDVPVNGDYDGDGVLDIAVYRPSTQTWWISKSQTQTVDSFKFGVAGDVPVVMDFNGDGKTDLVAYRPSDRTWNMSNASGNPSQNFTSVQWGLSTDILVPADYDGDNKDDIAVYRPSDGTWYIVRSSDGGFTFTRFGISTDIAVPGDYDGDGKTDIAVYRPSTGVWYLNRSTSGFSAQAFGTSTDKPIPAAYHP